VVVNGPAAMDATLFTGGILAPMTDLDSEGTIVAMLVAMFVLIDNTAVVEGGTFVVNTPFPRVISAA
jgi:hypothetical protein